MRIIAGQHRGRPLAAPPGLDIRPTADRTRQALFNLLEHGRLAANGSRVAGAVVLDAFAGTGALALEALSRGAVAATCIDLNRAALDQVRANAATLGETERLHALAVDATRPPPADRPHGLVFLDPPYGQDMASAAIAALDAAGWIGPDALVVVETGAKEDLPPPEGFRLEDSRRYGRAKVWLMTRA